MTGWTDLTDIQDFINKFDENMNKLVEDWYTSTCVIKIIKKSKFEALDFHRDTFDEHKLRKLIEQYKDNFELKFYQRCVFDKEEYYCFIIIDDDKSTINYSGFIQNRKLYTDNIIIELNGLDIKAIESEDELSMLRYMGMLNFSRLFSIAETVVLDDCSFDIDIIAPTVRTRRMELTKLIIDKCRFEQCTKISKLAELFPALQELEVTNTKFGDTMILDNLLDDSIVKSVNFTGTDFGKIKSAEKAFYNCIELTKIEGISDWNMSECTNCNNMFLHCSDLTCLDISNWQLQHTNLRGFLGHCYDLRRINISNLKFYTNKVAGMFYSIDNSAEITLNNKIKFFDDFSKPLDVAGLLYLSSEGSTELNISRQLFDITPVKEEVVQKSLREFLNLVDKLIQFKLDENESYVTIHSGVNEETVRNILQDLTNNIYRQKEKVISNQMEIVNTSKKEFLDKLKVKNDIMGNKYKIYDFYIGLLVVGNSADECKIYIMNGGE